MKTKDIVFLSELFSLPETKLTKVMNDDSKFGIILLLPQLKDVEKKYKNLVKEAQNKLRDKQWDAYSQRLKVWQTEGDEALSKEERDEISAYFSNANKSITKFMEQELDKDVDLDITPIKDNIRQIILSNDFCLPDVQRLMDISK